MILKRRRFTRDFTLQVLQEIETVKTVLQTAREHQRYPILIGRCQRQHRQYAERPFVSNGNRYTDETPIAELERSIGCVVHSLSVCPLRPKANAGAAPGVMTATSTPTAGPRRR